MWKEMKELMRTIYEENSFVVDEIMIGIVYFPIIILAHFFPCIQKRWVVFTFSRADKAWVRDPAIKKSLFDHLLNNVKGKEGGKCGTVRVLEIGPGTGHNFQYYPTGVHVTTLEVAPQLAAAALETSQKYPNLLFQHMVGNVEEMRVIPDESFDFVVATYVFCCIRDHDRAMEEIFRVLKPGGKFLSEEIILTPEEYPVRRFFTKTFNFVHTIVTAGCRLAHGDHRISMQKVGFDIADMVYEAPASGLRIQSDTVYGAAIKPLYDPMH